jgi:hypothetical protein
MLKTLTLIALFAGMMFAADDPQKLKTNTFTEWTFNNALIRPEQGKKLPIQDCNDLRPIPAWCNSGNEESVGQNHPWKFLAGVDSNGNIQLKNNNKNSTEFQRLVFGAPKFSLGAAQTESIISQRYCLVEEHGDCQSWSDYMPAVTCMLPATETSCRVDTSDSSTAGLPWARASSSDDIFSIGDKRFDREFSFEPQPSWDASVLVDRYGTTLAIVREGNLYVKAGETAESILTKLIEVATK